MCSHVTCNKIVRDFEHLKLFPRPGVSRQGCRGGHATDASGFHSHNSSQMFRVGEDGALGGPSTKDKKLGEGLWAQGSSHIPLIKRFCAVDNSYFGSQAKPVPAFSFPLPHNEPWGCCQGDRGASWMLVEVWLSLNWPLVLCVLKVRP